MLRVGRVHLAVCVQGVVRFPLGSAFNVDKDNIWHKESARHVTVVRLAIFVSTAPEYLRGHAKRALRTFTRLQWAIGRLLAQHVQLARLVTHHMAHVVLPRVASATSVLSDSSS